MRAAAGARTVAAVVGFVLAVVVCSCCRVRQRLPRPAVRLRRHLPDRARSGSTSSPGYTGQISLGHGAFMAIGGYTTAILISTRACSSRPRLHERHEGPLDDPDRGTRRRRWPGCLFGIPALRLSGLYLALATFAIAVATAGRDQALRGLHRRRRRGQPVRPARPDRRHRRRHDLRAPPHVQRLALLPLAGRSRSSRSRWRGSCCAAAPAARSAPCATARPRPPRPASTSPRYKTLAFGISAALRRGRRLAVRDRDHLRQPGHVPDLALDLPARRRRRRRARLARRAARGRGLHPVHADLWAQNADRLIPDWLPWLGDLDTSSPGAPAVAFGVVLIAIMLAPADGRRRPDPAGVGGRE